MIYVIYILAGLGLYFAIQISIGLFQLMQVFKYFKANPVTLPIEKPKHIQNIINEVGEDKFYDLYNKYRDSL